MIQPRWITAGRNRLVLLFGKYALKIPSLRSWRDFCFGCLNSQNEATAYRDDPQHRCPVLWISPGGFLLVMPRAEEMTEDEFYEIDTRSMFDGREYEPEHKRDSFGWLNDKPVAIDYGW